MNFMNKFKLPKDKKAKWLKALRSNKYRQGKGTLYNKEADSYCCLGVAKKERLCKSDEFVPNSFVSENFLPLKIQGNLSFKNDFSKWSFNRIANWIEKNL